MAKIDSSKARGAMLVDDEPAYSRPPQSRAEDFAPRRSPARKFAQPSDDFDGEAIVPRSRRVPVRNGILPLWMRTRAGKTALVVMVLVVLGTCVALVLMVQHFLDHDPRFRIDTADSIQIVDNSQLTRNELLSVFGSDIGRNIFYVPMAQRRAALEQIPWVEHATVMRLLPNQLRVAVRERTPIAFVRVGDQIKLVDGAGVILNMPPSMIAAKHFSFPVVSGIRPGDPLSERGARMQLYQRFVQALDSSGEHFSANLSEVDLSDPEDVRTTLPAKSSDLLLHFGDENFLARYRIFQAHVNAWEQQYPHLASVDLRYDDQVVLKMADGTSPDPADTGAPALQAAASAAAAAPAVKHTVAKHHHAVARRHARSRG